MLSGYNKHDGEGLHLSWKRPLSVTSLAFIRVCSMKPWPPEMLHQEEMDYGAN